MQDSADDVEMKTWVVVISSRGFSFFPISSEKPLNQQIRVKDEKRNPDKRRNGGFGNFRPHHINIKQKRNKYQPSLVPKL